MAHAPGWHLLDNSFAPADGGIALPALNLSGNGTALRIASLDRADPPDYRPGGVPRGAAFNANVFRLGVSASMPPIPVVCSVAGFDPAQTPIRWRLVCRHVLARFTQSGDYRYRGTCRVLEREWRGESRTASFTLFGADSPACACTYGDGSRAAGGHGVLQVAVPLAGATLSDAVHLRITGANPSPADVLSWLDDRLRGFDPNVVHMLRAVFRHESRFVQFAATPQSAVWVTFGDAQHADPVQPDCRVRFDWPGDPPGYPLASFDFGVGISQWTHPDRLTPEIAWDWRENIRIGVNLFLDALGRCYRPGLTWKDWALAAWAAYNGSGPAASAYARLLAAGADGGLVSGDSVRAAPQLALLAPPPPLPAPPRWIVA